jgi:glycosyltransferase involved in cell wall biosynthesis
MATTSHLSMSIPTIIYIGGFALPDRNAAAQRVRNNARVLRSLGYRVVLLGTSRTHTYERTLHPSDTGEADIEGWEIGYPKSRSQWFDMIQADWPLRLLAERGDVHPDNIAAVICYNHPAIAQIKIARLARSWGASIISDCTEWYAARRWNSPSNIVKNLDVPLRMHWVNRRMDGIITTSPYMTDFYRPTGLPIIEIPTLMEKPIGDLPLNEAVAVPMPLFAVASGFTEGTRAEDVHDRIDWVIDLLDGAAAQGYNFVLRIVGVDRERYLSVFPNHGPILEKLGERIIFMGRVPRKEVLSHLQASAFAFVLRHESRVTLAGFPSKYSEAVTYGTPVIINDLPSVRAYHVEDRTGFSLNPIDRARSIAKACQILSLDQIQISDMKQYCRECRAFIPSSFEEKMRKFLASMNI